MVAFFVINQIYYYNGRPDIAYKTFEGILIDLFQRGLLQKQIYQRVPFYRLRVFTDSAFTKREEIFHIPFKRRTLVAPQRFSIAGFPCLYLANSVYTAWEKLHRPALENLCFAKFISQLPLSFIDLSLQNFKTRIDESEDYLIFFENIAIYSILVACSIKVAFPTHSFKPEYIFPQFVLRWCKEENDIDGVMYDSTRIHAKSVGSFQNFVIPVADYQRNTDFCPNLTGKLKLTLPYMIDHLSDSQIIENELITDISQIFSKELHGIIPFQESIFARIESFLQNQELRRLS